MIVAVGGGVRKGTTDVTMMYGYWEDGKRWGLWSLFYIVIISSIY